MLKIRIGYLKITIAFLSCVIFLPSCQKQDTVYDLEREILFSRIDGDIFYIDFLQEEANKYFRKGWSKLRKNITRLGVYPGSRLAFSLREKKSLVLFCKCRRYAKGDFPIESFLIKINNRELEQLDIKEKNLNLFQITIPVKFLKNGENIFDIFYRSGDSSVKTLPPEKRKKRNFSLVFNELILTSLTRPDLKEEYAKIKNRLIGKKAGVFIQNIPSSIDLSLKLAPGSSFSGRYEFFPFKHSGVQKDGFDLIISVQSPDGDKKIVLNLSLEKNPSKNKIKFDLAGTEGIIRLQIKAGDPGPKKGFAGFLVWEKASILSKEFEKRPQEFQKKEINTIRDELSQLNTIIIVLDAARAGHFSNYGYTRPTTPNISEFARDAFVFTQAFSESLSTRTSIGTLFTGFPLSVTGLYRITSRIPEELVTLARMFGSKGFKTTGFTGVGNIGSNFDFHKGFDEYYELYKNQDFYRKSQEYKPYLFPWLEANRDKKFFLYSHFKEPHAAYKPLPPFQGMFSGSFKNKVDLSLYQEMADDLTEEEVEYIKACYDENLASADSVFGEIVEKMKEHNLLERSIIFLLSDHGEFLGEHGREFGHSRQFYEEGIHIPLIVRLPKGLIPGPPKKIDSLVKMSDLFATLADINGFDIPEEILEGRSVLPLFLGSSEEINSEIYIEKLGVRGTCCRTKRYKLIFWETGKKEFYDLLLDPNEIENIYEKDRIRAEYFLTILKKRMEKQKITRALLIKSVSSKKEPDLNQIDKKTLENLKTLGYIKYP